MTTQTTRATRATTRQSTAFLDGARGLAALTIAIYHTFLFTGRTGETTRAFPVLSRAFLPGQGAVAVFIVLSGFVLTAPIVRHGGRLPSGLRVYLLRRARRILPPYYAALLLALGLIAFVPVLGHAAGTAWDTKVPVTTSGVVSHVLLVQDVRPHWVFQIDGPMWSVAVEWQLYLVLPLMLVPLRRRVGSVVTVALAGLTGTILAIAVPASQIAHPWLLGCFALGLLAAELLYGTGDEWWRGRLLRVLNGRSVGLASVVLVGFLAAMGQALSGVLVVADVLVAAVAASWIVVLATDASPRVLRLRAALESRSLLGLGLFSYSLYLVHTPVLALLNLLTLDRPWPLVVRLSLMLAVALPTAITVAYAFHRLVERRFLTSQQQKVVDTLVER